jgi:hypothetical protein
LPTSDSEIPPQGCSHPSQTYRPAKDSPFIPLANRMNAPLILVAPEGVLRVAFLTCELAHTVAVTHSQVVLEIQ